MQRSLLSPAISFNTRSIHFGRIWESLSFITYRNSPYFYFQVRPKSWLLAEGKWSRYRCRPFLIAWVPSAASNSFYIQPFNHCSQTFKSPTSLSILYRCLNSAILWFLNRIIYLILCNLAAGLIFKPSFPFLSDCLCPSLPPLGDNEAQIHEMCSNWALRIMSYFTF